MWIKRAPLVLVRLSLRGQRRRLWLCLPLALYVPQNLLLAWDGLLALIPNQPGVWLRRAVDTVHRILIELMSAPPQTIADVDLTDGPSHVRVAVRTWGFGGDKA